MSTETTMDELLRDLQAKNKGMSKEKLLALLKIQTKVQDDMDADKEVDKQTQTIEGDLKKKAADVISKGFTEMADVATSARMAEALAAQGATDAKGAIYE